MAYLRECVRRNIRNDLERAIGDPRRRGLVTRNSLRELVRESNQRLVLFCQFHSLIINNV